MDEGIAKRGVLDGKESPDNVSEVIQEKGELARLLGELVRGGW